mgnify:FL=1
MKLVIYPAVETERLERIAAVAAQTKIVNAETEDEARASISDADALFGRVTALMLAAAPKLRWVQAPTVSLEHYVFPELVEHPLTLTNMRGIFSDVIADQVFGYIICFARNLHIYVRQQTRGKWEPVGGEGQRSTFLAGPGTVSAIDRAHGHLCDATLGVVGFGGIGREIARRGRAFSMRALAVDVDPGETTADVEWLRGMNALETLLSASDYVVVTVPHTPETAGFFNRQQFRKMRRDGYFINIGRGATVVLDDLTAALAAGEIAGAALDVYETEPLPAEHPLWQMENVILTPHVAGYGRRIAGRHLNVFLDNLARFLGGEPLQNVVDKACWF